MKGYCALRKIIAPAAANNDTPAPMARAARSAMSPPPPPIGDTAFPATWTGMGDKVGQRKGVGIGTGAGSSALRDTVARPASGDSGDGGGGVGEDIRTNLVTVEGVAGSVAADAPATGCGRNGIRVGSAAGIGAGVIVGKGVTTN